MAELKKRNAKPAWYRRFGKQYPFITLFFSIQFFMVIDYLHSLFSYLLLGFTRVGNPMDPPLQFWQNCGYQRIGDIAYPVLFCEYDSNTFLNPLLRAVLWGTEAFAVFTLLITGTLIFVWALGGIMWLFGRKTGAMDRSNMIKLTILFCAMIGVLWVRYAVLR